MAMIFDITNTFEKGEKNNIKQINTSIDKVGRFNQIKFYAINILPLLFDRFIVEMKMKMNMNFARIRNKMASKYREITCKKVNCVADIVSLSLSLNILIAQISLNKCLILINMNIYQRNRNDAHGMGRTFI